MNRIQRTALITALAIAMSLMFPDVAYTAENTQYIKWGRHEAYIAGYPDGSFRPNEYMTREEAASVFYELLGDSETTENTDAAFIDVGADRWSSSVINALAAKGIISGNEDGLFRPEDNITRAEMAVFMAALTDSDYTAKTFSDIKGHWAEKSIEIAATQGWIAGYTDGTFKPDKFITRAEAVLFINSALGRMPENAEDLLPDMKVFKDNADSDKWYYIAIQEAANIHEYALKASGCETWTLVL